MTNINTAKLIFDISDNVSELLMKQSKNELVTLEDSWKTMSLIESLIDEYDESLLISINRTGSEHNYSTQGFRLEMLGADKILTFETTNSKAKTIDEFVMFMDNCLHELKQIQTTDVIYN